MPLGPVLSGHLVTPVRSSSGSRRTDRREPFLFGSSVHKDISERLPQFNRSLYLQVKEVLDVNKAQRHIRGGLATRLKYRGE